MLIFKPLTNIKEQSTSKQQDATEIDYIKI